MNPTPETARDAPADHGARERDAAARAADAGARLAAVASGERGGAAAESAGVYERGRAAELRALAERLRELATEAPTLARRAHEAETPDRERLLQRHFDLVFEVLQASASLVRLAAVSAAVDADPTEAARRGASERHAAALEARSAHELAGVALRAVAAELPDAPEGRLRLRVADAIREEVDALLGETRPPAPFASAADPH